MRSVTAEEPHGPSKQRFSRPLEGRRQIDIVKFVGNTVRRGGSIEGKRGSGNDEKAKWEISVYNAPMLGAHTRLNPAGCASGLAAIRYVDKNEDER